MVVKIKMAHTSLVSRVKNTTEKNRKKITWRATSAIWRIFAELDKPKGTLSKTNLTSMHVSMF